MASTSFEHEFDVGDLVVHRRPDDSHGMSSADQWSVLDVIYSSACGGVRYLVRQGPSFVPVEMYEFELEAWEVYATRVKLTS